MINNRIYRTKQSKIRLLNQIINQEVMMKLIRHKYRIKMIVILIIQELHLKG